METQRIIGKHALILVARGQNEIASQIFVYDHIREIRADITTLEVKVLMDYDTSFFRVFKVIPTKELDKEKATKLIIDFYNNLLNASMKLTAEEVQNIRLQREKKLSKLNNEKNE